MLILRSYQQRKAKAMDFLNTNDYTQITALLDDPAHKKLTKGSTMALEWKTVLLIKKALLT
jgi:hypothetical protein